MLESGDRKLDLKTESWMLEFGMWKLGVGGWRLKTSKWSLGARGWGLCDPLVPTE